MEDLNQVSNEAKQLLPRIKQSLDLQNRFTYHKPFGNQPERYELLRSRARELAELIVDNTPMSREQSLALTKLEECTFWSNSAIARNEVPPKCTCGPTDVCSNCAREAHSDA